MENNEVKTDELSQLSEMMNQFKVQTEKSDYVPEPLDEEAGEASESIETETVTTESKAETKPKNAKKNALEFVNPKMAITIFDILMSRTFAGIANMTGVFEKTATKRDFTLDADEKKALEKPLAEYLETLEIKMDDKLSALILVVVLIYGGKAFELYGKSEQNESVPRGTSESSESWKGDKRYFQTGDKAGTLKPKHK